MDKRFLYSSNKGNSKKWVKHETNGRDNRSRKWKSVKNIQYGKKAQEIEEALKLQRENEKYRQEQNISSSVLSNLSSESNQPSSVSNYTKNHKNEMSNTNDDHSEFIPGYSFDNTTQRYYKSDKSLPFLSASLQERNQMFHSTWNQVHFLFHRTIYSHRNQYGHHNHHGCFFKSIGYTQIIANRMKLNHIPFDRMDMIMTKNNSYLSVNRTHIVISGLNPMKTLILSRDELLKPYNGTQSLPWKVIPTPINSLSSLTNTKVIDIALNPNPDYTTVVGTLLSHYVSQRGSIVQPALCVHTPHGCRIGKVLNSTTENHDHEGYSFSWHPDGKSIYVCTERSLNFVPIEQTYESITSLFRTDHNHSHQGKSIDVPKVYVNSYESPYYVGYIGMRSGHIKLVDERTDQNCNTVDMGKLRYCVDHMESIDHHRKIVCQDITGTILIYDIRKPSKIYRILKHGNDKHCLHNKFWISENENLLVTSVHPPTSSYSYPTFKQDRYKEERDNVEVDEEEKSWGINRDPCVENIDYYLGIWNLRNYLGDGNNFNSNDKVPISMIRYELPNLPSEIGITTRTTAMSRNGTYIQPWSERYVPHNDISLAGDYYHLNRKDDESMNNPWEGLFGLIKRSDLENPSLSSLGTLVQGELLI